MIVVNVSEEDLEWFSSDYSKPLNVAAKFVDLDQNITEIPEKGVSPSKSIQILRVQ
jgi:hypothetical protein